MTVSLVDASGAFRAWVHSLPGLTGPGNPLPNGLHHGARSPSQGVWAEIGGPQFRALDDVADRVRVVVEVKAVGGKLDGGPYGAAERAANALARAIADRHPRVVVTTKTGELVLIVACVEVQGPVFSGDVGGEIAFTVDATMVMQPA